MVEPKKNEERVLIVDLENKPIGGELRSIMRKENLVHRSSYIFLYNSKYSSMISIALGNNSMSRRERLQRIICPAITHFAQEVWFKREKATLRVQFVNWKKRWE